MWWMNTISIQCCLLNLFWFQTRIGDQKGLKMVVLFSVVSESVELLCQASSFFLPRVSRTCWRCIHHHRLHNKITCLFKFLSIDWMCGICPPPPPIYHGKTLYGQITNRGIIPVPSAFNPYYPTKYHQQQKPILYINRGSGYWGNILVLIPIKVSHLRVSLMPNMTRNERQNKEFKCAQQRVWF
jgi:hypothetical protein